MFGSQPALLQGIQFVPGLQADAPTPSLGSGQRSITSLIPPSFLSRLNLQFADGPRAYSPPSPYPICCSLSQDWCLLQPQSLGPGNQFLLRLIKHLSRNFPWARCTFCVSQPWADLWSALTLCMTILLFANLSLLLDVKLFGGRGQFQV